MLISPGIYRIRNVKTHTLIDQAGPGNKIHGWRHNESADQHWFVQPSGDGVVLKNVEFGQYAYTTRIQNGGRVFASNNLVVWNLSRDGNEWTISLPGTNLVAEIGDGNEADGAGLILWENLGYKHQRWQFEKISDGQPQQLEQQSRSLPEEHLPPQEYQSLLPKLQQMSQQLPVFLVSPGIYFLKNVMSDTLVSLYGGSTDEGAEISGCEHNGGNFQKWQLQPTGRGQNMTLRNVQTNTYLWFRGQSFVPSFKVKSSHQPQEYIITAANRGF